MKDDRVFLNVNPACTARENRDVPVAHPFKKRKCRDVVCQLVRIHLQTELNTVERVRSFVFEKRLRNQVSMNDQGADRKATKRCDGGAREDIALVD